MAHPYDELRKVMEATAIQSGNAASAALKIDGYQFVQPEDATWAEFCYEVGEEATAAQLGQGSDSGALTKVPCFVQIDVFVPEKQYGNGVGNRLAEDLSRPFSRDKVLVGEVGYILTQPASVRPLREQGAPRGFKRYVARVPFTFYFQG